MLTQTQIQEIRNSLKRRFAELRETIRQELLTSDEQNYIELAGKVHDIEEESVADLLVDLQLASIDRHVNEIREIDAALLRIADHSYGRCADCDSDIESQRLLIQPTAKRCLSCQTRYEQTFSQTRQASF